MSKNEDIGTMDMQDYLLDFDRYDDTVMDCIPVNEATVQARTELTVFDPAGFTYYSYELDEWKCDSWLAK